MRTVIVKRRKLPYIFLATVSLLMIILASVFLYQKPGEAADVSKFDPGNIMSDATMSNKGSMNVQQIQTFLNSKNTCNNTNTYLAAQYPHLKYTVKDGKFVCMAKDTFNGQSAARIIWDVAQEFNINPQALIVLLEKEQGLITDTWPNHVQYRTATGYGCPDTAPCDAQYFGLKNQLRQAASLFRTVLNGGWSNYPVGRTYVQYNPNAACGGSIVNIQNRATSALYRYTPYQPNRSALNAGYGTGDSCGAYGNRNFWMLFTDWFGSTQSSGFKSLDNPRWMKISKNTQKVRAYTGEKFGPIIEAGSQAKFVDKVYVGNRWIARTQWDYLNGNLDGLPADELSEINFENIPATYKVLNKDTHKVNPITEKKLEKSPSASLFKAVDKVTINNKTYLRTEWEKQNNRTGGFLTTDVDDFRLLDFITPRYMVTKKTTNKIDILSGNITGSIPPNTTYYFNKLIRMNGKTYAQAQLDNGTNLVVSVDDLNEIDSKNPYYPFVKPRMMYVSDSTIKYNVLTGDTVDGQINKGVTAFFVDQIKINNIWYARTKWDQENGNLSGIRVDKLEEVPIVDISDKWITLTSNSKKIDPILNINYEDVKKGAKALYVDKVTVLNKEYYRTEWEASQSRPRFIPIDALSE